MNERARRKILPLNPTAKSSPKPITELTAIEPPYRLLANTLNPSELAALKEYSCSIGWFAGRPTGDTLGADLYYNHFDRWLYSHRGNFVLCSSLLEPVS